MCGSAATSRAQSVRTDIALHTTCRLEVRDRAQGFGTAFSRTEE
ncbi:hypothetical protein ACIQU5_19875 [Streptomyces sp. NPDC090306]